MHNMRGAALPFATYVTFIHSAWVIGFEVVSILSMWMAWMSAQLTYKCCFILVGWFPFVDFRRMFSLIIWEEIVGIDAVCCIRHIGMHRVICEAEIGEDIDVIFVYFCFFSSFHDVELSWRRAQSHSRLNIFEVFHFHRFRGVTFIW